MKKLITAILFLPLLIGKDTTNQKDDLTELSDWISSKRMVTIKQLGGNLAISGDVRSEFFTVNERKNNIKQIGPNSQNPNIPDQAFKVKHHFLIDYRTGLTWCSTKVRFEYEKQKITDTGTKVKLERAILGARVYETDSKTVDLEFGRSKINYYFDSRVQFGSYMDGLIFKFDSISENFGESYFHFSPFIVNELIHQYGYIGEVGVLNFLSTGLYLKYSLINWDTKRQENEIDANRFRFVISQITAGYKFIMPLAEKSTTIYAAYLINTQAKPLAILNFNKQNKASYIGFNIGRLSKKGDWSIGGIYEYVEEQSIPEFDLIGIGKGNSSGIGLYSTLPKGKGVPTTRATATGSTGYRGFNANFSYLISSNLSISQSYSQSNSLHYLCNDFHYKIYFFEVAYAF